MRRMLRHDEPRPFRLLALDIDGTVMHWGGSVSAAVVEAVEKVRMSDTHVILATGRNVAATLPVARTLGIRRGYAVCSNGAVTIKLDPAAPEGYTTVEEVTFDPRLALELIRAEMPDAMAAVEEPGCTFRTSHPFPEDELIGPQRVVDSFEELIDGPATRVVVVKPGADTSHFDELVRRIGLYDVTYAVGYTAWLDLTPPEVSKASALEQLRERLGVDLAHTVAAGDGNNDKEMLEWAAHSAAMGNATDEVKAFASEVLPRIEDDGLVVLLERLTAGVRL